MPGPSPPHPRRFRRQPARSTPEGRHLPVLLSEVLSALRPQLGERVVDCTVGLAGHAKALAAAVGRDGELMGFDLDADNLCRARLELEPLGTPFHLHHGNFAAVAVKLAEHGWQGTDILLADLGMSSMQVDDAERGFSYVRAGPLDMRMDRTRGATAADLLATLPMEELQAAFEEFGDEPAARAIAAAIVRQRALEPIQSTVQLASLIGEAVGQPTQASQGRRLRTGKNQWQTHPAARVFQALRILVNREMANLEHLLRTLPALLRPGGRAAILSFHSGEDRRVKQAFKDGFARGVYQAISTEPIRASFQEKQGNPRSRSAKLRWAVRPG